MEELISLNDFVTKYVETGCAVVQIRKIGNYAEFLKQPLKLEMFVPCDEEGNVLEEPKITNIQDANFDIDYLEKYNNAKEKVLFEGFEYIKDFRTVRGEYIPTLKKEDFEIDIEWGSFYVCDLKRVETIKDLTPYNLTLTKNATNNEL